MTIRLNFEAQTPDELRNQVFQMANTWAGQLVQSGNMQQAPAAEEKPKAKRGRKPKAKPEAPAEEPVAATQYVEKQDLSETALAEAPNEPEQSAKTQTETEQQIGYDALLSKMSDCVNQVCAVKKGAPKEEFIAAKKAAFQDLLSGFEQADGSPVAKLKELPEDQYGAMSQKVDETLAKIGG